MADIKEFPDIANSRELDKIREMAERNAETANDMRSIASEVEDGQITSISVLVVYGDGDIKHWANFEDRLSLLGALEYCKTQLG